MFTTELWAGGKIDTLCQWRRNDFQVGGAGALSHFFLLGMESKNNLPSNLGSSSDFGHFILVTCQTKDFFVTFMKSANVLYVSRIHPLQRTGLGDASPSFRRPWGKEHQFINR